MYKAGLGGSYHYTRQGGRTATQTNVCTEIKSCTQQGGGTATQTNVCTEIKSCTEQLHKQMLVMIMSHVEHILPHFAIIVINVLKLNSKSFSFKFRD